MPRCAVVFRLKGGDKMDKIKNIIILVLAVAALWLAFKPAGTPGDETAVVISARADIQPGTVIAEDMLETLTLPRRYMQSGAYEVRSMTDIKLPVGSVAAVRISKGDQLTQNCLIAGAKPPAEARATDKKSLSQEHYVEGLKYYQNANYEKAKEEWAASVKLYPKNEDAVAGLKRIAQITGK